MSNTSYDLISLNGVSIPDVKKGSLSITPVYKYEEHETEGGGKVIEEISDGNLMLTGTVSFSGLFEAEIQTIYAAMRNVSTMTIYSPATNTTRTFVALIIPTENAKIIHDENGNAWSFGFDFEEIGDVTDD